MNDFQEEFQQEKAKKWVSTEGEPIQVKQSDNVGRNVVDNFETATRRRNAKKGLIVAFSFGCILRNRQSKTR